ncbi:hypothetical protein K493DRAFT_404790 [Basidiobolus meristosporus CBS 931.73]|uniref:Phosphatidylethanolamine N-methyltransferase n=1 Tax=Basidiobolus meristosporus CBS 931.73 TaxID=1314790 RepID=A0A1Y1Z1A6_9FUNG|nr:hypothetical protein K493DRAFT_404790 [Basidiobolus meristosporus CBS 931.73]|eukprot:ORY04072.1 hypothetical protein K493DRAFT_404790 [Basidiobolus meristosporus CBS 931.73]
MYAEHPTEYTFQTSPKGSHITYAKTPTGQAFKLPYIPDVFTTLFDPEVDKSIVEYLTLCTFFGQISLFFILEDAVRQSFFIYSFLFWRSLHHLGIGLLLRYQSRDHGLVRFLNERRWFSEGSAQHPFILSILRSKMGEDYSCEESPIEFNTWLLFRQLVDLVVVNDFFSYVCFALSFFRISSESTIFALALRWGIGVGLILFQLRIQINIHSSPENHSVYWGCFFFQSDKTPFSQPNSWASLFDTIGCVGYYGMTLITSSYTVLWGSLLAHVTQLLFILFVENPHTAREHRRKYPSPTDPSPQSHLGGQTVLVLDLFRSADIFVLLIVVYCAILTPIVATLSASALNWFLVVHCLAWKLFHSCGLGAILYLQRKRRFWINHFVAFGGGVRDAFENWSNIYQLSLSMAYVSVLIVALNGYTVPTEWSSSILLQHLLGLFLLFMHLWMAANAFELMGSYGWFYGDFFFDKSPEFAIHRLNVDADTFKGQAAALGLSILVNNCWMYSIVVVSLVANGIFILWIEGNPSVHPHPRSHSPSPFHTPSIQPPQNI